MYTCAHVVVCMYMYACMYNVYALYVGLCACVIQYIQYTSVLAYTHMYLYVYYVCM